MTIQSVEHAETTAAYAPDTRIVFRHGVQVAEEADALVVAHEAGAGFRLRKLAPAVHAKLVALTYQPVRYADLAGDLEPVARRQLDQALPRLRMLLATSVTAGDREVMRVELRAADAAYRPASLDPGTPVKLSKFAYFRGRGDTLVLESPLTAHRAVLSDPAARALATRLGTATSAADLATADLPVADAVTVLAHLVGAGFVDTGEHAGAGVRFAADESDVLRQWEFHDLLFHARSRFGRHDSPYGGRFPFVGQIEPQPPVKPQPTGPAVDLHRPALDDILKVDPSLIAVMEGRQSVRRYGTKPITVRQLGEFLYRVARVRGTYGPRADRGMPYEGSSRPYPCGGASYELELYLTVRRCEGLAEGIWFYDPEHHRLHLVNDDLADRDTMIGVASMSTGGIANPDIAITMTSRFQRLSWKYQSIAYSVTLKHAGVLYQTMYLVATAMGLAPCGLGSGSLDLSSRILGLDFLRESAVGEFLLGSLPDEPEVPEAVRREEDWRAGNDPEWAAAALRLLPGRTNT
jgi:SagB-type dehydrogenase family enzyme